MQIYSFWCKIEINELEEMKMRNEWDLTLIYSSDDAWEKDLLELSEDVKQLESLKGQLHDVAGLKKYVKLDRVASNRLSKLYCYASFKHDLNQKDDQNKLMYQRIYSAYSEIVAKTSFIIPEILANDVDAVMKMVASDKDLEVIKFKMEQLFRSQDYFLDAKSEAIMANYKESLGGFNNLYDALAVADNTSVEVILTNGEKLLLTESNFQYYLQKLPKQEDRKIVFEAIFKFYNQHKSTFAGIYNGIMQAELAEVKNRKYSSILQSKLYYNAIPKEVFTSLIETARNNTKAVKDYYELRKKFFKLDELHTYDRFLQFAKSSKVYTYEASKEMVLDACKALGDDFYQHACSALEDGRVSVFTKDGKRTGAYSSSLYNEGTFILLNHNDNLESAFTIAHEAGHSIHSLYSNENQSSENADYTIFVAEIASTFNEQLFLDYVMAHSKDKEEKIEMVQKAIDNIIATFFRQTLFANYEYLAHALVENHLPVTSNALDDIMKELYMDYYGIDLSKEQYKENVWAYIPHFFHTPFYVYQYATSFAASLAIYENVKTGNPQALKNYITMLSKGGSDYPVDIVKSAGVDLTKPQAFEAVIHRLEELTAQLKELLGE